MTAVLAAAGSALLALTVLVASHAVNTMVSKEYAAWGPALASALLRASSYLMPGDQREGWTDEVLAMLDTHIEATDTAGVWFATRTFLGMPLAAFTARRDDVERESAPRPPAVLDGAAERGTHISDLSAELTEIVDPATGERFVRFNGGEYVSRRLVKMTTTGFTTYLQDGEPTSRPVTTRRDRSRRRGRGGKA